MAGGTSTGWYKIRRDRINAVTSFALWRTQLTQPTTHANVLAEVLGSSPDAIAFRNKIGYNSLTDTLSVFDEFILEVSTDTNFATEETADSMLSRISAMTAIPTVAYRFSAVNPSPLAANGVVTGDWLDSRIPNPAGGNLADSPALASGYFEFSVIATQPGNVLIQTGDSVDNNPPVGSDHQLLANIPLALDPESSKYVASGKISTLAWARMIFRNGALANEVKLMLAPGPLGATAPANPTSPQVVSIAGRTNQPTQFGVNNITTSPALITPVPTAGFKVSLVGLRITNPGNNPETIELDNIANCNLNKWTIVVPSNSTLTLDIDMDRPLLANTAGVGIAMVFVTPPTTTHTLVHYLLVPA